MVLLVAARWRRPPSLDCDKDATPVACVAIVLVCTMAVRVLSVSLWSAFSRSQVARRGGCSLAVAGTVVAFHVVREGTFLLAPASR